MKIAHAFPLALCLVLPLRAQAPTAPPQYGTLELSFVDSVTGNAVTAAKATIEQKLSLTQKGAKFTATSDEQGHAIFKDLLPGTYGVTGVETPGYAPVSPYPTIPIPQTAVNPLENARGPKVKLDRLGSIEGRIFDANGDPLVGVRVGAYPELVTAGRRQAFGPVKGSQTNDRGEYLLSDLKPDRYFVKVDVGNLNRQIALKASRNKQNSARPEGYSDTFYPNTSDFQQAQVVIAGPAAHLENFDLRLKKTPLFRVDGEVLGIPDSTGAKEVTLERCDADGYPLERTPSVVSGPKFVFTGVPAGIYCATYRQGKTRGPTIDPDFFASELVTVGPERDITDLKLHVTPVGPIEGTIRVDGKAPMKKFRVMLDPSALGTTFDSAESDPTGSFRFPRVPPDRFQITTVVADNDVFLKSVTYNEHDSPSGILETHGEKGMLLLDFATGTGEIHGQVDGGGASLAGMRVTVVGDSPLSQRDDSISSNRLDAQGTFTALRLAPGTYRVFVWSEDPGTNLMRLAQFRTRFFAQSTQVIVTSGQSTSATAKPIPVEVIRSVMRTF